MCTIQHVLWDADVDKQKIVASATLLIEYKILRHCGKVRPAFAACQMPKCSTVHPDHCCFFDLQVGHVEDVVVDDGYRGQRMGQRLVSCTLVHCPNTQDCCAGYPTQSCCLYRVIAALVAHAQSQGCYKVILDCSDSNVPFYEKCGFTRKEVQMVSYLRHAAL